MIKNNFNGNLLKFGLFISIFMFQGEIATKPNSPSDSLTFEFERLLKDNIIKIWYPKVIDTIGGYFSSFSHTWEPVNPQLDLQKSE